MTDATESSPGPKTMEDVRLHVRRLLDDTPAMRGNTTAIPLLMQSAIRFCEGAFNPAMLRPMILVEVHGKAAVEKMLEFFWQELLALRPHAERLHEGETDEQLDDALDYVSSQLRDIRRRSR